MEKLGWNKSSLGELGKITSSKRIFKSEYVKEGVPFYRTKEVKNLANGNDIATELFIKKERFDEIVDKFGSPKEGDILLTAIGTIGEIYVVKGNDPFYFKDGNVLWLKDFDSLDKHFLRYALMAFVDELRLLSRGAAYNALPINKLKNYEIFVPTIPEQKRIVAILDQAFADIEQARAKTEQNLKNARELFESYLQQVFSQRGEGWTETTLGELCERMEYGTSSKSQPEGDVPVLRMGNLQRGLLDWEKLVYTCSKGDIDKLLLKDNDVLFNRTNSPELVGKTAIYRNERPAIFAGYLIRVHRKEELLDAGYLNYFLNSNLAREYGCKIMSHSTNQANISGTKLKTYPITIPNLNKQKEFSTTFRLLEIEVRKVEDLYRRKLGLLDNLKKSILQKAFSGELTKTSDDETSKGAAA